MGGSQSRYINSPAIHKMKFSVTTSKCAYNAKSAKWNCVTERASTSNGASNTGNTGNNREKNTKNTKAQNELKKNFKATKLTPGNSDEYFTFFE